MEADSSSQTESGSTESGGTTQEAREKIVAGLLSGEGLEKELKKARWWERLRDMLVVREARALRTPIRSSADLDRDNKELDLQLKSRVASFALSAVRWELLTTNTVFILYAWLGKHWKVPPSAIEVWLGSTVVQVIGILYIISSYLFPKRGSQLAAPEQPKDGDE